MRCEAMNAVSPTATDEERRCTHEVGVWIFDGSYGPKHLCDSHAKSYQKAGMELRKGEKIPSECDILMVSSRCCELGTYCCIVHHNKQGKDDV